MSEAKDGTVILRDLLDARVKRQYDKFGEVASKITAEQYTEMISILYFLIDFSSSQLNALEEHKALMDDITRISNKSKENIAKSKE